MKFKSYYTFYLVNIIFIISYYIAAFNLQSFVILTIFYILNLCIYPYETFLVSEIKSKKGVLHFQRWAIIELGFFSIYIHKIFVEDKDKHLHNHPWNYRNIILKGGYVEETFDDNGNPICNIMLPYKMSKRKASKYHKIQSVFGTTTTLFFTSGRKYDWGYCVDGYHVDNEEYRKNKNLGLYK